MSDVIFARNYAELLGQFDAYAGYSDAIKPQFAAVYDHAAWKKAIEANAKVLYEEYIENHPKGMYLDAVMSSLSLLISIENEEKDIKRFAPLIEWANKNKIGTGRLPRNRYELSELIELDLSWCRLEDLPDSISELKNLQRLNLRVNSIKNIPKSIAFLHKLVVINFSGNSLSEFPEGIREMQNLEELYLHGNNINYIPKWIKELKKLKILDIGRNNILLLPEEICSLKNMIELDIHENNITEIPRSLEQLTNLKNLCLFGNTYNNVPDRKNLIQNIPNSIKNMQSLSDKSRFQIKFSSSPMRHIFWCYKWIIQFILMGLFFCGFIVAILILDFIFNWIKSFFSS